MVCFNQFNFWFMTNFWDIWCITNFQFSYTIKNSNGLHFKSFKCQVNLYDLFPLVYESKFGALLKPFKCLSFKLCGFVSFKAHYENNFINIQTNFKGLPSYYKIGTVMLHDSRAQRKSLNIHFELIRCCELYKLWHFQVPIQNSIKNSKKKNNSGLLQTMMELFNIYST